MNMSLHSRRVGNNIYEVSDGKNILFYAPFKNLVVRGWKVARIIQRFLIRLIPDNYNIPRNVLRPTVLELDMSHACSLNCIYCSVNSNEEDRKLRMTFDLAKIAIDYVMNVSKEENDPFAIVFIGKGEPTLNWEILVKCVEYIKIQKQKIGVNGKTIIVTNGIVSAEKARWLAKNIDHIALSWDGSPKIQNLQRPLINKGDSYDIVERTASIFRDERAYFEIRTTWTNINVDKMVEFTRMFVTYHPFELNYQPLLEVGRATESNLSKPIVESFAENFIESKIIANEAGIDVIMPQVETKRLNRKFCHAYEGTGLHLTAEGNITACECVFSENDGIAGKYLVYGRVRDGKIEIDSEKISFLRGIRVDNIPSCRRCFARWHCAGGCLNTHFQFSENPLAERTHRECEITKQIVWKILGRLIASNFEKGGDKHAAKDPVMDRSRSYRTSKR
jgi:uncharacterized protein